MDSSKFLVNGFSVLVLGLIATSAYFGGRGVSALAETQMLRDAEASPRARTALAEPAWLATHSAVAILNRNPFDSGKRALSEEPRAPKPAEPAPPSDPLTASDCADIQVYSTIISQDPRWSSAVVRGPGEPRGRVLRVGALLAGKELVFIGENPLRGTPAVWFQDAAGLCQTALFENKQARPSGTPAARPAARPSGTGTPLPSEIAARIHKVSAEEVHVDRSALDAVLADYSQLLRGSRMVPTWRDGTLVGFRVEGIAQNTLLDHLALKSGDQIEAINDVPITSPDKALQAYMNLRNASEVRVRVLRNGQSVGIGYKIR